MGFAKSTVAATFEPTPTVPPPKKTPTGAHTSIKGDTAHPLMMAIMEHEPQMPLVQVRLQLEATVVSLTPW
ncbi:hypothetical protein DSO57_1027333 [Entomophthora muscae]|uniref:Uncharacterized protein n=1 Tax=Entomophthora muscae TaxID=34485 RepID=A0ACC2T1Q0_9FUNG|nr:hypothetical protein DSO57_1027333 [Entomophthora muscae]